jgi:predicted transglutaminase-like cysteine proteinase
MKNTSGCGRFRRAAVCCAFLFAVFLGWTNPIRAAADTWDNVLGKRLQGTAQDRGIWPGLAPIWRQVMEDNARNPVFGEGGAAAFPTAYQQYWKNLLEVCRNKDPLQKARLVSGFINTQFSGIQDKAVYGIGEKWATPMEFVSNRGGDCEDFAIIKYFALRSLGYEPESMRILVVEVPSYNVWHALLALLTRGRVYIFDNNFRPHDLALPQDGKLAAFFRLHVAFNEKGAWYYE